MANAPHVELMQLLAQYATGDLRLAALRTRLDTPHMQTAIAALAGQTLTVGPQGDQITVGNITHAKNIAIGSGAIAIEIGEFVLRLPSPPTVAFQVPYPPNPLFVGRDAQLAALEQILATESSAILTPVIAGMGGIGKTQLASEFAHAQRTAFPGGVFWLNMEQPETIATQLALCAGPGGLDLDGYDSLTADERRDQVKAVWAQAEPRRLVVFDNLEDPKILNQWRPFVGSSRLLITSRRDDWPAQLKRVRLKELARPASRTLLLSPRAVDQGKDVTTLLADPNVRVETDQICDALGDLPLALAVAGAYLKLSPGTTLHSYAERLTTNPLADEQRTSVIMADVLAEAGLPTGRERGIMATFTISYQQLRTDAPVDALALTMLHAAAYCASAPIPQQILWCVGDVAGDNIDEVERRDAAIRRLRATGLVAIDFEDAPTFSDPTDAGGEPPLLVLHRLIAAYVRSLLSEKDVEEVQRELIRALTNAGNAAVNRGLPRQSAPLLPHLLYVNALLRNSDYTPSGPFYSVLARILQAQGDLAAARPYAERALAIREQTLGPNHTATANSLNDLGHLLYAQGDLAAARPYAERALAIQEQMLGPNHPSTASSLNNLGHLLQAQGDLAKARLYLERALAIQEQMLGPNHPDTANSLNNLGTLLYAQGDLVGARLLNERALATREQVLGPSHPDTAQSLNNLGTLLHKQGDLATARSCLERALTIWEQVLGPNHPNTASSLNNLGTLLRDLGDLMAARSSLERALAIQEQVLGPNHPDMAMSLNNLGHLLLDQGDLDEARPYVERALAIQEQILGPNHPDMAMSLNNLGTLLCVQGDLAAARPYVERALAIYEQAFGPSHPATAIIRKNYQRLLKQMPDQ